MATVPELQILIPVYNEGDKIHKVLDHLEASVRTPFEIHILYDSEEDNTLAALDRYLSHGIIRRIRNRGRGVHGAVMTGFEAATAPAVLVFPADDTFNGPIIDRMMEAFRDGAELVSASRFMPGGCMKGCPWIKAVLVRSAAFTLYHLARIPTHDSSNGFRLFSRRLIRTVRVESSEGWAFSIEMLVKCRRLGWKISEVPAQWFERATGKSRFRLWKWLPIYLRWYRYAFATAFLRKGPSEVPVR